MVYAFELNFARRAVLQSWTDALNKNNNIYNNNYFRNM